jgi:hypothetical protein
MDDHLLYRKMLANSGEIPTAARPRPGRPTLTGFFIACAVALGIAGVGTFLLLGLPGAVIYEVTGRLILGTDPWANLPPDGAWPLSLYLSILWPASIPVGYLLGSGVAYFTGRHLRGVILFAVMTAWNITLTIGMYQLG